MHELIEQFCTALEAWDERSGAGSIYFEVIMRYLGGSVPDACTAPAELAAPDRSGDPLLQLTDPEQAYSVDDVRRTLEFLIHRVGVNAGFLIGALIRAVDSDLEQTADSYSKRVEELPSSAEVGQLFEQFSSKGTLPPNAERALGDMAEFLQQRLAALPGRGKRQFPFDAWRELVTPLLDSNMMYTELYGEWDEDEL